MMVEAAIHFREALASLPAQLELDEAAQAAAREKMKAYHGEHAYLPSRLDGVLLQWLYIHEDGNPNPEGKKRELVMNDRSGDYNWWHAVYHPPILKFLDAFGFAEVMIIEPERRVVVYSVNKRPEYGTSLLEGPFADSNLARWVKASLQAGKDGSREAVSMVDFEPYAPSKGAPAGFISAPVFQGDEVVGVLAIQMPVDAINRAMTFGGRWKEVGLGDSGETYLVAKDLTMRSAARGAGGADAVLRRRVQTEATQRARDGETATAVIERPDGRKVLSAFGPLAIEGLEWSIVAEIDHKEAMAASAAFDAQAEQISAGVWRTASVAGLVVMLVAACITLLLTRTIVRPIRRIMRKIRAIVEQRDLTARIEVDTADEVGALAEHLNEFISAVHDSVLHIRTMAESVDADAGEMQTTAANLGAASTMLKDEATPMSAAVERVSTSMRSMGICSFCGVSTAGPREASLGW